MSDITKAERDELRKLHKAAYTSSTFEEEEQASIEWDRACYTGVPRLLDALDAAEAELDEREGDMHLRIRAGYDATVAESWKAKVAKIEAERDALQAKLDALVASYGSIAIATERSRQIRKWTAEHDAEHHGGLLAMQAAGLAVMGTGCFVFGLEANKEMPDDWGLQAKHRTDRRQQLVIAGALIAAEIDRIDRLMGSHAAIAAATGKEKP